MEVTIEITDYCPNECDYCSTNAGPIRHNIVGRKEINTFLNRASNDNNITRINISGGEPLSHPDFYGILNLCKSYTRNVWVYTNALTQIIYNSDIIKEMKVEANTCLVPGREIYIPKNVDKVHLLQLVRQGRAKDMNPGKYHISNNIEKMSDCDHNCDTCQHILLQADRKIVAAPCKKDYDEK